MPLLLPSGGTRKFYVRGKQGAKYITEGVEIEKFAKNVFLGGGAFFSSEG